MKIPDSNTGVITACMKKKTGKVRFINAQKGKKCTKKEKKVTFNQAGPQGEQGPVGPVGAQGEPGPSAAYVATRTNAKSLSELTFVGGNNIVTLSLPAGSYTLQGTTSVKAMNAQTAVIDCQWSASGGTVTQVPQTGTALGSYTNQPFSVSATYTNAAAGTVSMVCWPKDSLPATYDGAAEAKGGIVTATRVGEVTVQ
jgi:hypothetical protein